MCFCLWTNCGAVLSSICRVPAPAVMILLLAGGVVRAADLPADVGAFVEERQTCDHFRGEGSDDPQRQAEIDAALDRYCTGSDARLAALKMKYANGPDAVRAALAEFEERIE